MTMILGNEIGRLDAYGANAPTTTKIPIYDTATKEVSYVTPTQVVGGSSNNLLDGVTSFDTLTDALVAGSGTNSTPHALGATAGNGLNFRFTSSNTTGDMRGMYLKLSFDAAAVSSQGGEALRAFTDVNNVDVAVGGTVNGSHITLSLTGDSATVDGAGNAIRATLGGSGTKTMTGTLSGVLIDLDLPSTVTLIGTEAAVRIGKSQDHEWPVAIAFDGTVGSGNAIETSTSNMGTAATAWAMHITVDGVSGYIPVFDNASWT